MEYCIIMRINNTKPHATVWLRLVNISSEEKNLVFKVNTLTIPTSLEAYQIVA
jgi:predicted nuclease of predicted toxin-antitoxin system